MYAYHTLIACYIDYHKVNYGKAAYSSCYGLRYHLERPCSYYFVLQLGGGGAHAMCLVIEATISVEKIKVNLTGNA